MAKVSATGTPRAAVAPVPASATARGVKVLVQPTSASGTGTLTARDSGSEDFQDVQLGAAETTTVDLSGDDVTVTIAVSGLTAIKVTSDDNGDEFDILVTPLN